MAMTLSRDKRAEEARKKGDQYRREKDLVLAAKQYEKSIKLFINSGLDYSLNIAGLYEKLADCYEKLGDRKNSNKCYAESASYFARINFPDRANEMKARIKTEGLEATVTGG